MEEAFVKKHRELENSFKKDQENIESMRDLIKKREIESEQIKYDITTTSKKGLKTHGKRKHSEKEVICAKKN